MFELLDRKQPQPRALTLRPLSEYFAHSLPSKHLEDPSGGICDVILRIDIFRCFTAGSDYLLIILARRQIEQIRLWDMRGI
jgi:hypothetical protein